MKKVLIALILLLGVTLTSTSCSKEEVNSFAVPAGSILVSMPGESGYTTFDTFNIASIVPASVPKGWSVDNIDLYKGTITVTAPSSFEDEEVEEGTLSLTGYTPLGVANSLTIYVAILPNADVDYCNAPANCYIANKPKTRFKFNGMVGGNATPLATSQVKLLWQSSDQLIKYLDLRDGVVRFYIDEVKEDDKPTGKVKPGNALIGGYDENDELLWSWHIWVTNSDPTADVITLGGKSLMNINLGGDANSKGSTEAEDILNGYGLYYQWGRKEPFVGPYSYNFSGNRNLSMFNAKGGELTLLYTEAAAEVSNVEYAAANPLCILLGNKDNGYDWLYDQHDDSLWAGATKSEQDPCPAGWRVPEASVFESLTITAKDDAMAWEEAQPMYGWWLEDTTNGATHFFSAAGRRNYLDGHLDNMNDDSFLPVPWSGYYWTRTVEGANAKALYFDLNTETRTWNGIDTSHSMQRANALPIRCVKE